MNKKYILTYDDIETIDIEMSSICNLKCPLCLSQQKNFMHAFQKQFIDIDMLIEKIKKFKNLKRIALAGDASEPTLHPDLLKFLDYIYNTDIALTLYTNANTHDEKWWYDLKNHLNKNSKVVFTICGLTQELHEKYRVGSNLAQVLKHAFAFKKDNKNNNDIMQYLKFEYNKHESQKKIDELLNQFSNKWLVKTDLTYERFNINSKLSDTDVRGENKLSFLYRQQLKRVLNSKHRCIDCYTYKNKFVRINNKGIVSPCVCYYLYNQTDFDNNGIFDYTDILAGKFDFCYECDKQMLEFFEKYEQEAFYMCS